MPMNNYNIDKFNNKENHQKKNISIAKKTSFSAILCALGVIILFLGSVIEIIDITTAALSSFLIVVCMIELGGYMPFLVYIATSVLSFLLLPNKTVVVMYVLFFGFYPILKKYIEKTPYILSWVIKFATFNAVFFVYYFVATKLFSVSLEQLKIYIVLLLNVIFFTFDLALSLFVTAYVKKFRTLLQVHRFFK